MCAVNHKIRIIIHLIIEHHNWIEDASIKDEVKKAKETVQRVLKPGGGDGTASRIGVASLLMDFQMLRFVVFFIGFCI